jgi:fructan beta-fructosidase
MRPSFFSAVVIVLVTMGFWGKSLSAQDTKAKEEGYPVLLAGRYLNVPIKTGAPKLALRLRVEGKVVREFPVEYATENPDFWVFVDVSSWRGKTGLVENGTQSDASADLSKITSSDLIKSHTPIYGERLRPQFHYTSKRGRLNDPNGLVYFGGEYHLFYQLHPYGWGSANKHWGHAITRDLVHWEEQAIALYPDALGEMFSGSGVVDWNNTSGFQTGREPPLVLIFTGAKHPRTQGLAYSNDRGRTWTKFPGNPVMPNISRGNRDPKVIWHEPSKQWVMTLSVGYPQSKGQPPRQTIEIFTSGNLKSWTFQSRNEGFHECPDLFELPIDSDPSRTRWILHGGSSKYQVGTFDGKSFVPETPLLTGHRGNAFYAGQTFSDVPGGRRVQVGFAMSSGEVAKKIFANMPFNQVITFPCDLTLRSTPDGPRLAWWPVPEIETLRVHTSTTGAMQLKSESSVAIPVASGLLDITLEFEVKGGRGLTLSVLGTDLAYLNESQTLVCGETKIPLPSVDGRVSYRVLRDEGLIEIFANKGLIYAPVSVVQPPAPDQAVQLTSPRGDVTVIRCEVSEMRSIWPPTATELP